MVTSVIGKRMEHSSDWNVGEVIHQSEVLFTICRMTPPAGSAMHAGNIVHIWPEENRMNENKLASDRRS